MLLPPVLCGTFWRGWTGSSCQIGQDLEGRRRALRRFVSGKVGLHAPSPWAELRKMLAMPMLAMPLLQKVVDGSRGFPLSGHLRFLVPLPWVRPASAPTVTPSGTENARSRSAEVYSWSNSLNRQCHADLFAPAAADNGQVHHLASVGLFDRFFKLGDITSALSIHRDDRLVRFADLA